MAEVTKAQVEDLGAKLEKFAKDLPKAERDVLGWVLQRASAASKQLTDEDLKGVAGGLTSVPLSGFQRPTSALIGKSLGGATVPGGTDPLSWRISWSW
jgi:hypothetical protein